MRKFTTRCATIDDIDSIYRICCEAEAPNCTKEAIAAKFLAILAKSGDSVFVAERCRRVVGFIHTTTEFSLVAPPQQVIVSLLAFNAYAGAELEAALLRAVRKHAGLSGEDMRRCVKRSRGSAE